MSSPNVTNRETVRDAFVALISSSMVGAGKSLYAVYGYQPDGEELKGKSPVMWVSSGPTTRDYRSVTQRKKTEFTLIVQSAVRLDAASNPAAVEDRLDKIEKAFADVFMDEDNTQTANWEMMEIDQSTPGYMVVGGNEYRVEITPVRIVTYDG